MHLALAASVALLLAAAPEGTPEKEQPAPKGGQNAGAPAGEQLPSKEEEPAQLTKLPKLVKYVEAVYPPDAAKEGREGVVVLAIDVDSAGAVEKVEVTEPAGHGFDEAAIEAAKQFVFEPAEAGKLGPVPVRITYRYRFTLKPAEKTWTATTAGGGPPAALTATAAGGAEPPPPRGVAEVNFLGTVREAGTRAPIELASIEVEIELAESATVALEGLEGVETSTDSDSRGRFRLRGLPPGEHKIIVRAPYFEVFEATERIVAGEALEVVYYLTRTERSPYEVIVRAQAPRKEVARRTIRIEEATRIPGAQGDAIRVIQNFPGVARTPFGLGLLVVRGAPPQDTGVFLDGHRMPILFHFGGIGGFTSVIHSRILDQINFYPGGFSAEYGRVSAGIVELQTRDAQTDRVHGEAEVQAVTLVPVTASVFLEGPITGKEEDGAFVFSLRRSSIDGVLALITSLFDSSVSLAPRYYDYQLRYDRPIGGDRRRMFSITAYGSDDELVIVGAGSVEGNAGGPDRTQSRTFFHRVNPRFVYKPDPDTSFTISPLFGWDSANTGAPAGNGSGNTLRIEASDWNLGTRVDGRMKLMDGVSLMLGGDFLYFNFINDSEIPAFAPVKDFPSPVNTDLPIRRDVVEIHAIAAALYTEFELKLVDGLTLWPGLRFDLYDVEANPQPLVDRRLVEGRAVLGLDPRITARYQATEDLVLKGQAGIYRQPPLPPQFFLNADLPQQTVDQYSFGFEVELIDKLSLDLQGFLRLGRQIPRFSNRTEVVGGRVRIMGYEPDGLARAYGAEMLLRLEKRWGLSGWIAYTLSKSEIRRERQDEWQSSFFFDQTHNLNVVGVYDLGLNWNAGVRFQFVSGGGLPSTTSRWYDADRDAYNRTTGELVRAPAFHQLDLYIEKRWMFDEWYLEWSLDVLNVYNRENTELYAPTFDFKREVAIPGIPFLPAYTRLKGVF